MRTSQIVDSFMADCRLRGLSPRTLETYGYHLKRLNMLSPIFPPKPDIIQQFLADVKGIYTADSFYRTFSAVDNYGHTRFNTSNFMKFVTRPRIPKIIMPTVSNTQLSVLAWRLEIASPRDRAIITLFIDCAIRSGEASNLKFDDIKEDTIIVHGKTGYRVVPISGFTRELLLDLPRHEDGFVFHGTGRYRDSRLLKTGFYKVVKRYLELAGYEGRQFGPQVLRRSFGRWWLLAGGDMKSLSLIFGHSSVATTDKYYTPLAIQDIANIHHKHTPGRVFEQIK